MRHAVAGFALVLLARVFGLSQGEGAAFGSVAVAGFEAYQGLTQSGAVELQDVGHGLVGVALVSLIPDRKAERATIAQIDLNMARIRAALRAECDSVRTGSKTFADSSMRTFARSVCAR